jgi:putative ABC transport system permease protein
MSMVAYDPLTDFAIEPRLQERLGHDPHPGQAVGGTYIFVPEGDQNIQLYGHHITLIDNMKPTGTAFDASMFLTFEMAHDVARISLTMAEQPLEIPPDSISAVMVRLEPSSNPDEAALEIMHDVPGVTPITRLDLVRVYRTQMSGLRTAVVSTIAITLGLFVGLISLVFSMAANERRRELGVLRAMGASRGFVFQSLLTEAGMLALAGGAAGIALAVLVITLFRQLIITSLNMPFLLPEVPALLVQVLAGLAVALVSVTAAALLPAYRISRLDPSIAMRE